MDNETLGRSLAVLLVLTRTGTSTDLADLSPVVPDHSWDKGTRRGRGEGNVHTYSGIEFRSHLERSESPLAHLEDILDRIRPYASSFSAFADQAALDDPGAVPVRIWLYTESPQDSAALDFSPTHLESIAALGAHLGVSTTFVDPETEIQH